MTVGEEHQVGVGGLAQIRWTVRKILSRFPRLLPQRTCGIAAHEEIPEGRRGAGEVEEVSRMRPGEDLWCISDEFAAKCVLETAVMYLNQNIQWHVLHTLSLC